MNAIYRDDVEFSRKNHVPEPPKKNPALGDKTPEFVEWLHQYRHDEFVKRYGVTGKGKVPIVETDPSTGMDVVKGPQNVSH